MTRLQRARLFFLGALLLSALIALGPTLTAPTQLAVGSPSGEAAAHFFGLWAGADGGHPFIRHSELANFPAGLHDDLADPLHTLFLLPGHWGLPGATLGWNLLVLTTLLLAGVGGWRLGRQLFPQTPEAAALLGIALVSSPTLQGVALSSGRTEYWAWAWMALPLSWCLSALRRPTAPRLGLACLGMLPLAWSGWQALILGLLVLGPSLLLLSRDHDRKWLLLFGASGALASGALLAVHLGQTDPWWISRLDPTGEVTPAANLAELLPWTPNTLVGDRLALPGIAACALAVLGVRKETRGWAALAAFSLLAMFGTRVALGERVFPGPMALLGWLPVISGVSAWPRLGLMAALPVAVLAGFGVVRLQARLGGWSLLLGGLLLAEGALFRPELPTAWRTHSLDPALEQALAQAPEGPLLEIPNAPFGLPLGSESLRDHGILQTRVHGRPTSRVSSPDIPAVTEHYDLALALQEGRHLNEVSCAPDPGPIDAGFRLLVLHKDQMLPGRAGHLERILTAQWGAPIAESQTWALYSLELGVGDGDC